MKQVTHTLKTGLIDIQEVPVPTLTDKFILVRTTASVISAGTEKSKIDMGKKSLVQKAKARPDLVRQVWHKVRSEGLWKTLETVNTRLGAANSLGYSSAGVVVAVGGLVDGIRSGDRVACGGAGYANHAELAVVPKNLAVKIPTSVSNEEAAFATLGAIALQGVRLADPKLGETVLVLGLGLLGQIAVQLLKANGCRVLGTDLNPVLVALCEKFGGIGLPSAAAAEIACRELTGGRGVDAVLVCAGTSSNQPIELCGRVTREKGRVVVVGAVRMDIPRENFFKKEINVVISRSYGPGRYDPDYEENGNDYPFAYVRFSEQRNMETILSLVAERRLDLESLITHRFELGQAVAAYELIEGKKQEHYLGIILQYDEYDEALGPDREVKRIGMTSEPIDRARIGISLAGAGNYATATLLPILRAHKDIELRGIVTASGRTAAGVAEQFGFSFCAPAFDELTCADTDAVMIATRHDTHADYVCQALKAGKHVYVEKPLALRSEELASIYQSLSQAGGRQLMVGFNRRFAPLTVKVTDHFSGISSPKIINIRVNAGYIPHDHWIQDPQFGGGRVIGEACHFVDLAAALVGSPLASVYCSGVRNSSPPLLNDNVCITLTFHDGSVANVIYLSNGPKALRKEFIEIFGGGRAAIIDDFREARLYQGDTGCEHIKQTTQDKGQRAMLLAWIAGIRSGNPAINFESLMTVSAGAIGAIESMTIGQPIAIGPWLWNGKDATLVAVS